MNLSTLFKLFWSPTDGWKQLLKACPSIPKLFILHVVPLSCIPPLMIFYSAKSADTFLLVDMLSPTINK